MVHLERSWNPHNPVLNPCPKCTCLPWDGLEFHHFKLVSWSVKCLNCVSFSSKSIKPKDGDGTSNLQCVGQKPRWQPGLVIATCSCEEEESCMDETLTCRI